MTKVELTLEEWNNLKKGDFIYPNGKGFKKKVLAVRRQRASGPSTNNWYKQGDTIKRIYFDKSSGGDVLLDYSQCYKRFHIKKNTSKWIGWNLNSKIRVKFTEQGYLRLATYESTYVKKRGRPKTIDDFKKEADSEGYLEILISQFMKIFGDYTTDDKFSLDVLIEVYDGI